MSEHDFKLYATPSFVEGVASLLDFGGVLNEYNESKSAKEADNRALLSDWEAVGFDIRAAMDIEDLNSANK